MRYYYGTIDKFIEEKGRTVTAKQLASIIKRDVDVGKWNIFNGGNKNTSADCSYIKGNFTHHEHLFITGKAVEFQELEQLIEPIIKVIPRQNN